MRLVFVENKKSTGTLLIFRDTGRGGGLLPSSDSNAAAGLSC